ncbi:MAG: hypothetical protein KGR98_05940 [Verrucomicrobia bacterium]|nr:hypothetical protein [Verrucomicrobiota bacterium]MDE3097929.1 hypothetical protein [Verrucomicrobiota bacterium]
MARWNSCNVLHLAFEAHRLWQFDAKGGKFVPGRQHQASDGGPLPPRMAAKSWNSLWQPKLNVAWLPAGEVFLRVIELPRSAAEETRSMVELQLEKLSPMPVAQIVWTFHTLAAASAELQNVVVVIASRAAVENFLGKLEGRGFQADRLEAPFLDQLEAADWLEAAGGVTACLYPGFRGPDTALAAWWSGQTLRNLSVITLPANGDRVKSLREQLTQLCWAGEMEGWLTGSPGWHLAADEAMAGEWETLLRETLNEPLKVLPPLPPEELAARTARRAAGAAGPGLLPAEFAERYRQQFSDRLWLHGLYAAGIVYAIFVAVYFAATTALGYKARGLEKQASDLGGGYTNVLHLQAEYTVLNERAQLQFEALDCWKLVAEKLPEALNLQRFSFSGGDRLNLSGTTTPDQLNTLLDFNTAMQNATVNGKPMFQTKGSSPVNPSTRGGTTSWSLSLELANSLPKTEVFR